MIVLKVLLLILKILGITILAILGLILLLLCLILFVPIRYTIEGSYYDKIKLEAKVSYLLKLVRARFVLEGKDKDLKIKVLWFTINGEKKAKKEKKSKSKSTAVKEDKDTKISKDVLLEQRVDKLEAEIKQETLERQAITNEEITKQPVNDEPVKDESVKDEPVKDEPENDKPDKDELVKEQSAQEEPSTQEQLIREDQFVQEDQQSQEVKSKKKTKKDKPKKEKNKKEKVKKSKPKKEKGESIFDKIKKGVAFLKDNKKTFDFILKKLKKLLKHILPGSHVINLHLGLGDPGTLGEIIGAVSVVRAMTNLIINVNPDFENKVIEGNFRFKGKIRLGTVLFIGISVYFNKDVKKLINMFKK